MVEEVAAWETALKMIEEGIRPPVVHVATGLSKTKLRLAYREFHGITPVKGPVRKYAYRCFKKVWQVVQASAFVKIYRHMGGDGIWRILDSNLVIDAYRVYKKTMVVTRAIDATTAWYVARDIREQLIQIRQCRHCRQEFLYDPRSDIMRRCYYCRRES